MNGTFSLQSFKHLNGTKVTHTRTLINLSHICLWTMHTISRRGVFGNTTCVKRLVLFLCCHHKNMCNCLTPHITVMFSQSWPKLFLQTKKEKRFFHKYLLSYSELQAASEPYK